MVSKNTLITDSWDSVYTYIQTTNPISTNNIFSAWNDTLATTKGYPIVILSVPRINWEKLNLNGKFTACEVNIPCQVYNLSAETVKSQTDEVIAKLHAGRDTFASAGFTNMNFEGMDYDAWTEGKKKIHRIGFDITFNYKENA